MHTYLRLLALVFCVSAVSAADAQPALHQPLGSMIPLVVLVLLALLVPVAIMILSRVLGPNRVGSKAKHEPYECGLLDTAGNAEERFSVKFYLIAMLFLVFDIEVAFLYPFALVFRDQPWQLLAVLGVFLLMLEAAYLYLYRKGALDWER